MAIMCEKWGKRPATTLTKVYINGVYSEQYLCSECDKSYTISHELFPDNIIALLFGVAKKNLLTDTGWAASNVIIRSPI